MSSPDLMSARAAIVECKRCTRLRSYCNRVATEKRAAFRHELYWGRPVPGFGDPLARVLILGLAPAAHGANRTGRVFTGDGVNGSGDFLMAALHHAGFANLATSQRVDDGLRLRDVFIAATVRCAPPDNKPLPEEIAACASHLDAEVAALPQLQVVVTLGKIAWDAWFQHLARKGTPIRPRPVFAHGAVFNSSTLSTSSTSGTFSTPGTLGTLGTSGTGTIGTSGTIGTFGTIVGCFHPSRQNTNTGKLTPPMYDVVFSQVVKQLLRPVLSERSESKGSP
jgi:uracil-DNA glycosylase